MTSTSREQAVVIGGGVSGLTAAYALLDAGIQPLLIEKDDRFGGLIKTDRIDGCELDAGPDSFIAAKPAVVALAHKLGIAGEIIGSDDAARRIFIVKGGEFVPMPPGMVFMVPGNLDAAFASPLFSSTAKLRLSEELNFQPKERHEDASVHEFIVEHFGEECLDYLTEPLLSGVYGGDAGSLSARSVLPKFLEYERTFGSLIRGVQQERAERTQAPARSLFLSFRGGMQTLTDALETSVFPRARKLQAEVQLVERKSEHWRLNTADGSIDAENVISACPAHVSARLLNASCPELSYQLAAIPYSSAVLVTLVYDRSELTHPLDGFGFLVPRKERRGIAAGTWVSTKFPSRTPPDRAALRAFFVGQDAVERMQHDDAKLIRQVRAEYSRLMGISAQPLFSTVYRWPNSMPQYTVGHEDRRAAIAKLTSEETGLFLCGNAYEGVGIPDCIRLAAEIPGRILARTFRSAR